MCLSDNLHSAKDHCLASAFNDFLEGEDWKDRTIEEFAQVVEVFFFVCCFCCHCFIIAVLFVEQDKFVHHPEVEKKNEEITQYAVNVNNKHNEAKLIMYLNGCIKKKEL